MCHLFLVIENKSLKITVGGKRFGNKIPKLDIFKESPNPIKVVFARSNYAHSIRVSVALFR